MKNFNVVLTYKDSPDFRSRVMARDSEHAVKLTVYNAMANGWPSKYAKAAVQEDPM